jgi:hypothetical protein
VSRDAKAVASLVSNWVVTSHEPMTRPVSVIMAAAIARLLNSNEKDKVNITDLLADYFVEQDEVDDRTVLDDVSDFEDDPTPVNVGECDANAAAAVSALVDHSSDCSSEDHQYVQAMEFRLVGYQSLLFAFIKTLFLILIN